MKASRGTRFTKADRQAIRAIEYGSGLAILFSQCDTGEQGAAIVPADREDRFAFFDATFIAPTPGGYVVTAGADTALGVFQDLRVAIATARNDVVARMATHDPEAYTTALLRALVRAGAVSEARVQSVRPGRYVEH